MRKYSVPFIISRSIRFFSACNPLIRCEFASNVSSFMGGIGEVSSGLIVTSGVTAFPASCVVGVAAPSLAFRASSCACKAAFDSGSLMTFICSSFSTTLTTSSTIPLPSGVLATASKPTATDDLRDKPSANA